MATKKELVEAYQFSRRRLVTAFLSGAPGGREVEPTKPTKSLVGGVALAVLLCAGGGVAGFLGGRPDSNWKSEGSFIISKDTGDQYVVLSGGDDAAIQRVPNFISGQLLLGTAEPEVFSVKDKYIRSVALGSDLGIESAPAGLPPGDALIQTGWTACTAEGRGVKINVAAQPDVTERSGGAFVVRTGGRLTWLIAQSPGGPAYRFELPANPTAQSTLLDALGFGASSLAPEVSDEWLNLFPLGPALTRQAFGVADTGRAATYPGLRTDLTGFLVGDLVQTPEGGYYLLGDDSPQRLSEFPALVYSALVAPPKELSSALSANFDPPDHPVEWPSLRPTPVTDGEMCGLLQEDDGASFVVLADQPGEDASAESLRPGSKDVDVEPSGGAYVLSGSDLTTDSGSPFVVDAKGAKYALVGPSVAEFIGYGEVDAPVVPDSWMSFFSDGVELSVNAARRLPEDASDDAAVQ
ncbi:type VII secretion protein EccB [Nocardioides houyundeii]|uniref:type VII secretion protein EccB n=1 Tax=Nocardioides houyundeii TaxID=2045452 RepID=UPI000C794A9E|nr:type VII secretion protein EccB [Nocardioides houyundeii]